MALELLYYNLIIPIKKIPDFDGYLLVEYDKVFGGDFRYDEYLYVESAMNYSDIESRLKYWNSRAGLVSKVEHNGRNHRVDLCCVGQGEGLCPDGVCEWIRYDPFRDCVFHVNDKQKKIVSLLPPNVDGYVVEGRFLSPTKNSRGVFGLDDDYWANFDSKGFFRFVLPLNWKREQSKGRITQKIGIHDFISNKQYVHEFELLPDKKSILEINGGDGTAQIHHDPFEPIDKEKVARIDAILHKTSLHKAETLTDAERNELLIDAIVHKISSDKAETLTDAERNELLTAIAEGTIKLKEDEPSTGVQGREVSIFIKSLSDKFDRFECEYFGWHTNPLLKQPDQTSPKSISFETILARKMEKHGYRFAEVSDPYQVDWNRTLFFRARKRITTDGTEVTLEVKILKITLTKYRESGQPCLVEEIIWEGNFTFASSFYQNHQKYIAERISKLINEKDTDQVEEW